MKPIGYQSPSTPSLSTMPATPRNDAAERYCPEMAAALARVPTVREAARKSSVVRATRTPSEPMTIVAMTTTTTAATATYPAVSTPAQSSTLSAKSSSLRSAVRM